jgi:hypothetical protein
MNMSFYEEALSRMDNEGGTSRPSAGLQYLAQAAPTEPSDDFMPTADTEQPAEMFSVYARLAMRWDARANATASLAHQAVSATA